MPKKIQLKNGLQVILAPSSKSPVVSVQMWVRTGSADEGKREEGLSHFIEHLVFKGTEKFKVGEIASLVEGSGGELNAYTSFDQTVFYVTISKNFFETGLDVISQMMGFPMFDPSEIDNEREVVIEEIKRGLDSLGRQASQCLFQTAFKKSAYRVPVIGYEKNIRQVSAKKIQSYYESRYTPQNMFLVVAGDFDVSTGRKQIEKYFNKLKKTKLKKIRRIQEPQQKKPRLKVNNAQFEQSICYAAWKVPGAGHKHIPALDVLAFILGQGDSSRLVRRLRIEAPLVNSVGTGNYLPLEGGLFMLSLGLEKAKWQQIYPIITEEIQSIQSFGPTQEELQKAITNLESGEYYAMETVDGLARRYGSVEFQFRDLKAFDRYFKELKALTPADIQKAAQKYLQTSTLSVAFTSKIKNKTEEKSIESGLKYWVKSFSKKTIRKKSSAKKIKTTPVLLKTNQTKKTEPELVRLSSGARVLFRTSNESAVLSAKCAFMGGLRYESMQEAGLSELFSRVWLTGTRHKSEIEIFENVDRIAAGLNTAVGRNSAGLSLDVLKNYEKQGADLFFESLYHPSFSSDGFEREKILQLQQIEHKVDNPSQIVFNLFLREMFKGHPYSKDPLGTKQILSTTGHADIQGYWSRLFSPKNMHFVFAGAVDKDFWLSQVEKYEADFLSQDQHKKLELSLSKLSESTTVFELNKKEQAHILFGYRSYGLTDHRRYILQLIQAILAGQGGRLFLELRDKESLAYSVSPTRLEGLEGGYFGAYIGCSPEKTQKALRMMREEFEKLCHHKVSSAELERAKKYTIGRHDIELQRTSAIASSLLYEDLYGLDFKEIFTFDKKIQTITAEEIQKVAQDLFGQTTVTSIVGPEAANVSI